MIGNGVSSGLVITNPLVLYRALVAQGRILPDQAQLRLALHLQKLYDRLIDYEPTVDYQHRLKQISQVVASGDNATPINSIGKRGIWSSLIEQKERRDTLALTRVLTDRESAQRLSSPKGLMLHGEVGTGKSMLIDLFADCLPTQKKRRWHFSTFMLETTARLEQLRRQRNGETAEDHSEHPLLVLARDMIETSPVLFLDEFQLPDRASSKIMSSLMTSFFNLGGVLIATSNRMPDELAKAAGVEFAPLPTRMQSLSQSLGLRGSAGKGEKLFAGQGEFADFLDLLKSRCEVWEMEGKRDYRRPDVTTDFRNNSEHAAPHSDTTTSVAASGLSEIPSETAVTAEASGENSPNLPKMFLTNGPDAGEGGSSTHNIQFESAMRIATSKVGEVPWVAQAIAVYGRLVPISRTYNGIASFTFDELCCTRLGPADYITIASTFHTIILLDVPILTSLLKNEARRFITLLDALYEARCKLLITAAAGPDHLFFPDLKPASKLSSPGQDVQDQDATYAETFAEAFQDANAPFRPNISSYTDGIDTTHARLQGILAPDALEDDPPNRIRRVSPFFEAAAKNGMSNEEASEHFEMQRAAPDFGRAATFTGEDEKFAYKRARSRLWEMCGENWWARTEEGWWRPVPLEVRRWERPAAVQSSFNSSAADVESIDSSKSAGEGIGMSRAVDQINDSLLFQHKANPMSASPFRTHSEPPPRFSASHIWGVLKWGKKAGAWGQGVEGLQDRQKDMSSKDIKDNKKS